MWKRTAQFLPQANRPPTYRARIFRTFVLVDEADAEPKSIAGVKLGRLAVAKNRQRHGLGRLLLVAAMKKFVEVFDSAGGIGLFVDAKDSEAKAYYERFGFVSLPDAPLLLFLPLQTIRDTLADSSAP